MGCRRSLPTAYVKLTPEIEKQIKRRRVAIKKDLAGAGSHYPREEVQQVLDYWKIEL